VDTVSDRLNPGELMRKWSGAILIGIAAIVTLTACTTQDHGKIQSGKILGKSHLDHWYETVGIPDPSEPGAVKYQQEEHGECWRISFTSNGQIAYTCIPLIEWQAYKVGDNYTYEGEGEG
jgi:hypothetical protein